MPVAAVEDVSAMSDEEFEASIAASEADDDEAIAAAPEPEPDPLLVDIGGQLSMLPGGKKATESTLRVIGGKFVVAGELKKGATIKIEMTLEVGEVAFVDMKDGATGQVVSCERRHKARPIGVKVL